MPEEKKEGGIDTEPRNHSRTRSGTGLATLRSYNDLRSMQDQMTLLAIDCGSPEERKKDKYTDNQQN